MKAYLFKYTYQTPGIRIGNPFTGKVEQSSVTHTEHKSVFADSKKEAEDKLIAWLGKGLPIPLEKWYNNLSIICETIE